MRLEKLNISNSKGKLKIAFAGGCLITILLIVLVNIIASKALYRRTESVQLAKGTVNYKVPDLNIIAMYQETSAKGQYEEIDTAPKTGYIINRTESVCKLNDTVLKDVSLVYSDGKVKVDNITQKGTKCYLYFDKLNTEKITTTLGTLEVNLDGPTNFAAMSCLRGTNVSTTGRIINNGNCHEEKNGLYKALGEDDKPTYYYRGTVNNNWVKFANLYWQIIRINEDGSYRLIYSYISGGQYALMEAGMHSNYTSSPNTLSSEYLGYQFVIGQNHGSSTNEANQSNVLKELNKWYEKNLSQYENKIDENVGFCNDRVSYQDENGTTLVNSAGTTSPQYFNAYVRIRKKFQPTYKCENKADYFTATTAKTGTKTLKHPIGLITADEAVYAGGNYSNPNYGYWLNVEHEYWTMSPYHFLNQPLEDKMFIVNGDGTVTSRFSFFGAVGIRPVINLKATTKFSTTDTGEKGTIENPYVVVD